MALTDGIVIVLVLTLVGVFPAWPYSREWGYYPSAAVSFVLFSLVVLLVARTV
jgi:hypothetical protein